MFDQVEHKIIEWLQTQNINAAARCPRCYKTTESQETKKQNVHFLQLNTQIGRQLILITYSRLFWPGSNYAADILAIYAYNVFDLNPL